MRFASILTRRVAIATFSSVSVLFSRAMTTPAASKVIDSHLHIWANTDEASKGFPYEQDPPENLANKASSSALLEQMQKNNVDGALIVQPINHKYDHSYVAEAIKAHPDRFKGMLLHDPSLPEAAALMALEELAGKGFVGVRFNPYLWPQLEEKKWQPMSEGAGLAVYKRCAELNMAVGVMCFQGLPLHFEDILQLVQASPETALVLDHFGFTSIDDPAAFDQLLELAKYPNVYVKISALFRLNDASPFERVQKERFQPLLETFGAERLMYGSDFPFVLEQPQQYAMVDLVSSWTKNENNRAAIMGGTAEKVFGAWGAPGTKTEL